MLIQRSTCRCGPRQEPARIVPAQFFSNGRKLQRDPSEQVRRIETPYCSSGHTKECILNLGVLRTSSVNVRHVSIPFGAPYAP